MKSIVRLSLTAATCALLGGFPVVSGSADAHEQHASAAAAKAPHAKTAQTAAVLRDLWIGHIFWVRNVATATFDENVAAAKAAEQQAVANAQALAGAIEPFYGAAAKESFFKLLAGHYGAIKAYLGAAISNDAAAQSKATEALTANADDIATFLSKANPHLPKDAVNGLLLAHGGHHIQQIQDLKDRRYEAEARTWDEMKAHVFQIADATADALAKQFPKKF